MTTTDIIHRYFESLKHKSGWEAFIADEMTFTNHATPVKHQIGKAAYLEATRRFFAMITAVELKDVIADGPKACALSRYELRGPDGRTFASDVAEVFRTQEGKIVSLEIYFDSAPYPKPPSAAKAEANAV